MSKLMLPWWLKIALKIFLSRIPINYSFWRSLGIFRHGYMTQPNYVFNVFNNHLQKSGIDKNNLYDKVILELGPGDSIATAIIAASYGAKAILVDVGEFATNDMLRYRNIVTFLKSSGLNPPDIEKASSVEDILIACNALYLTQGFRSLSFIEDDSVDLIFSQAVLEHIRKKDFVSTIKENLRILSHKGVASHWVDLKDHLGGSLNNLRFSEKIWESNFFANSGFYTNRIRFFNMLDIFKESGFKINVVNTKYWERLPIKKTILSNEFSSLSEEDLIVQGFHVILNKNESS